MRYINRFSFIYIILPLFTLVSCKTITPLQSAKELGPLGAYLYYYEGLQNRLYGNIPQAISLFYNSLQIDSTSSATYYELALSYTALNQIDESIHYLKRAVELDSSNVYYLSYLSALYLSIDEYNESLPLQKRLVSIDSSLHNRTQLALIHSQLGNYNEAIRIFNILKKEYGYVSRVSEALARVYYESGEIEKAKNEFSVLTMNEPDNPMYYLLESDLHFKKGYDSIGFALINEALKIDPTFPYSNLEMHERLKEVGQIKKSLKYLTIAIESPDLHHQEKVQAVYPLLFNPTYFNNHTLSIDTLIATLITSYPKQIIVNDLAFDHLIRRGDYENARKVLNRILLMDRQNPNRWEMAISMDYSQTNYDNALDLARSAIELFPDYYMFYIYKSLIYSDINKSELAIKVLEQGLKNTKSDYEAQSEFYTMLADIHYSSGSQRKAFRLYRKGLKYNPDNARLLNNYSYYLSIQQKNLNKALIMSTRAVELEPSNASYIDTKGWVLFQLGNYEEAKSVLQRALMESGNNSAIILEHYGDVLYKTGNIQGAKVYWERAKLTGEGSEFLNDKVEKGSFIN